MRNVLFAIFGMMLAAGSLLAQEGKVGYTNPEYILAFMPEAQEAQAELTTYQNQLYQQAQAKYQDLQKKFELYRQEAPNLIDAVREDREAELQQLQQSAQEFEANAPQRLAQREAKLLQPLYNKIQVAINEVAEEQGYTYIYNSSALLYAPEGDEISALVFEKLNIEPPTQEELELGSNPETTGGQ